MIKLRGEFLPGTALSYSSDFLKFFVIYCKSSFLQFNKMLLEVEVQGKNLRVILYLEAKFEKYCYSIQTKIIKTVDRMIGKGINIYYSSYNLQ